MAEVKKTPAAKPAPKASEAQPAVAKATAKTPVKANEAKAAEPKAVAPKTAAPKTAEVAEVKPAPAPKTAAQKAAAPKKSKEKTIYFLGTGRRKKSIARVRITPTGTGLIEVNSLPLEQFFVSDILRLIVNQPLVLTNSQSRHDIFVNVKGGGLSGQAGAVRHGIARALIKFNEGLKPELKKAGLLTRDSRAKERKKPGLKKARRAPQFSKR